MRALELDDCCGCCGRSVPVNAEWCEDCVTHIDPRSELPPWDRTYLARYRRGCPFQIADLDVAALAE